MLDQRLVRDNPETIASALGRRGKAVDLTRLQLIAQQQRDLEETRSSLQADGNRIGKEVGKRIQGGADPKGEEVAALRREGNTIKQRVAVLRRWQLSNQLGPAAQLSQPARDCPGRRKQQRRASSLGNTSEDGLEEYWQIAERLGLFETERSVRIAQSRFVTLMGQGARLERALINFMLDLHTSKGYREVLPPVLVNSASLTGSGQLPKFAEESFRCAEDDLWLTPTAEVPVTSLHRDEIIPVDQLPLRFSVSAGKPAVMAAHPRLDPLAPVQQGEPTGLYIPTSRRMRMSKSLLMPKRFFRLSSCPTGCWISALAIWVSRPNAPTTLKSGCRVLGPIGRFRAAASAETSRHGAPQFARRKEKTPDWCTP